MAELSSLEFSPPEMSLSLLLISQSKCLIFLVVYRRYQGSTEYRKIAIGGPQSKKVENRCSRGQSPGPHWGNTTPPRPPSLLLGSQKCCPRHCFDSCNIFIGSSEELAASATEISKRYEELLIAGLQLASCSSDAESQQEMLGYLRTISISR